MILIPRKSVALTRSFSSQYSDRVFFACCYSTFSLGGGGGFESWGFVAPKAISGLNVWIWLSGNRFGSKQWRFVLLNEKSRSKIVRLIPMIPLNQYLLVLIFSLTIKKIRRYLYQDPPRSLNPLQYVLFLAFLWLILFSDRFDCNVSLKAQTV